MLKYNMNNFNKVIITNIHDRTTRYECNDIIGYKEHLKSNQNMVEIIGEYNQQIKPIFDIDAYDTKPDINLIINDINKLFPNKPVKYAEREPREFKGKTKFSYRFYVLNVRITSKNLKQLILNSGLNTNSIYDMSIYDKNKVLFLPLTTKKADENKVPPLIPIDCDIFDCCASYIKEDYEDWDIKFKVEEPIQKPIIKKVVEEIDDEDEDETPEKFNRLSNLIKLIKPSRSDNYDNWSKMVWCIINICNKENIDKVKCYELVQQFSKLSKNNYDQFKVYSWFDSNYHNVRETGYCWNYLLHTVIKEDNPKYYENVKQSYYNMKIEYEKNNVKILYPPMIVHIDKKGNNIIQTINQCEKTNRHLKCCIKEENKKGETVYKEKKFIDMWLDDPKIKRYDTYVFRPYPLNVEEYEYNTWLDFQITKTPYKENNKIIERFLDYLKNLINNDEVSKYIIAYFANRIQNPAIRNKVCIILYGEEGDGKNRLLDIFKNIIGENYFIELESGKQLFESHSCFEKEKLFICVNEAKGKDNYENSEILKARITTNKLTINPKGIQAFEIDNYCDYLMTTNNHNAVDLKDKSRRYLYIETTSYYSRNTEFFNSFSDDIVENKEALRVIYEYLKNFNIKDIIPSGNFQNHIPLTEIQKELVKNNRDKILYFLEDFIEPYKEIEDEFITVNNAALFDAWNNWVSNNKIEIKYNNISFHTRLGHLMKKKINIDKTIIRKDTNKNNFIYHKELIEYFYNLNNS